MISRSGKVRCLEHPTSVLTQLDGGHGKSDSTTFVDICERCVPESLLERRLKGLGSGLQTAFPGEYVDAKVNASMLRKTARKDGRAVLLVERNEVRRGQPERERACDDAAGASANDQIERGAHVDRWNIPAARERGGERREVRRGVRPAHASAVETQHTERSNCHECAF